MALSNEQKREIACKLLGSITAQSKLYPQHYSSGGSINDSHLCRFVRNGEIVIISVKYTDRGGRRPCIGFYWCTSQKTQRLDSLEKVSWRQGFYIDKESITGKENGWVPFCRDNCETADQMYGQIVSPGNDREEWCSLFKEMMEWGSKEFDLQPGFYDIEKGFIGTRGNANNRSEEENEENDDQEETREMSQRNLIVFGAPGTGKSHQLNSKTQAKFVDGDVLRYERVTFYPTYSYSQFVGTYKPVMKQVQERDGMGRLVAGSDGRPIVKEDIAYEFVPGPFLRVLVKALNDPRKEYCLVIEEINRANAAAVFGDIFQLLDRDRNGESEYSIEASEDVKKFLSNALKESGKEVSDSLKIPANMYIWATMNSADQGVFPMDTAFKRRWEFEYINIDNGEVDCDAWKIEGSNGCKWNTIRKFINVLLSRHGVNEDKLMGAHFVKATNNAVDDEAFKSKVLMYLWEDAARMCRRQMFGDILTYSDLCDKWSRLGITVFEKDSELNKSEDNSALKKMYDELKGATVDVGWEAADTGNGPQEGNA